MTEETIFAEALERSTPVERTAYLDEACAGDAVLRQRLETLLRSHEAGGAFLGKPAIQCAAEELAGQGCADDTQGELPADGDAAEALDFLAPSDKPGSLGRLGHYEVLEVIGRGGMGIVLRAFDEKLHRVVAIKVMAAQLATNATARKRFRREAQAAAAVTHDHIVTFHAVEETNRLPYLVMQYVSGMSLQQRLDGDGPLEVREIVRIGMQTAAGLAAAHAHGLIHRDIKPANILLENGIERVKITDFGLARAVADASLTQSGVVAGTPQYMSPEQARGEGVGQRTDLFSLGSVLYAMCTGRPPFRADSNMAVLKRVCDDTPSAIRETNPEIPDWLVAVVTKLHAKSPDDRFQSAAEVAELLKVHLAHLQHPSVVPLPDMSSLLSPRQRLAGGEERSRAKRRRLAVAAVLLCLIGGLALTEATGVTRLSATVIRIFAPKGPPIVEGDSPGVKVRIEGPGAFVVLGGKGIEVRKYDTLAEAVQGASGGDTIEIRGNGPFVTRQFSLGNNALTIRAGAGFRPVLRFDVPEDSEQDCALFKPLASLVLEGLDLGFVPRQKVVRVDSMLIFIPTNAPVHIANCRIVGDPRSTCLWVGNSGVHEPLRVEIRNTEIVGPGHWGPIVCQGFRMERCFLDNCVLYGTRPLTMVLRDLEEKAASIRLNRNTIVSHKVDRTLGDVELGSAIPLWLMSSVDSDMTRAVKPITLEVSKNVFDSDDGVIHVVQQKENVPGANPLALPKAKSLVQRLVDWRDRGNLYAVGDTFFTWSQTTHPPFRAPERMGKLATLEEWNGFWRQTAAGSLVGSPKYQMGNLRRKPCEELTPEDFRLRRDSPGYRAAKDGKDFGADVDLVGPGPAYERWKKTPDYQQWLKDTKQAKVDLPKAEPKAFVLQGGKGAAERKFDTLAEAVQGASSGDTIEIRGNGPFVSEPINIQGNALTIRSGDGFVPVITLNSRDYPADYSLLQTNARLVLEGLEFRHLGPKESAVLRVIVRSNAAHTYVANCRFFMEGVGTYPIHAVEPPVYHVRNSLFLGQIWTCLPLGDPAKKSLIEFDNCVVIGIKDGMALDTMQHEEPMRLTRNTVVVPGPALTLWGRAPPAGDSPEVICPRRLELSASIFDGPRAVQYYENHSLPKGLTLTQAKVRLQHLLSWKEHKNLYARNKLYLHFALDDPAQRGDSLTNLAEWQRFWGAGDTHSIEGRPRYQGGDLLAKLSATPEKLMPIDFRLRRDSPGYRAGKDGKDLGADVDLVGPGPAYERWKKTPAYQQWLKDSGQVKK